jgi:TRAP transporter TAXI family solute receptor
MIRSLVIAVIAASLSLPWVRAQAAASYKIVTASERGTYYAIGKDLAKFVAPDATIDLEVLPTSGSAENVKLLRFEPGVKFAIVQADVFQAFIDRASGGNRDADKMIRPLRVILPLYNTEIHYIVRSDSQLNYLHDIKDAKINGGLLGSGAALITATLYRMMFNAPIPESNASYMAMEEALVKLITDKSVDVVVVAAGQPSPLVANMKPEAQKLIKFLKFDPNHPTSKLPLQTYTPLTIRATSYPNVVTEDFTTIGVGAYLVTYDYNMQQTVEHLSKFGRALCQNFSTLQAKGHPKWREVALTLPDLQPGWVYYSPVAREIRSCAAAKAKAKPVKACTPEERILGLCN